jgi:hypothetical protein
MAAGAELNSVGVEFQPLPTRGYPVHLWRVASEV